MSALDDALHAAEYIGTTPKLCDPRARAERVGAEIPNQLQAVSDAIDTLEIAEGPEIGAEMQALIRDARTGLANVLALAKNMRGSR